VFEVQPCVAYGQRLKRWDLFFGKRKRPCVNGGL
jgi:hypothetical protein